MRHSYNWSLTSTSPSRSTIVLANSHWFCLITIFHVDIGQISHISCTKQASVREHILVEESKHIILPGAKLALCSFLCFRELTRMSPSYDAVKLFAFSYSENVQTMHRTLIYFCLVLLHTAVHEPRNKTTLLISQWGKFTTKQRCSSELASLAFRPTLPERADVPIVTARVSVREKPAALCHSNIYIYPPQKWLIRLTMFPDNLFWPLSCSYCLAACDLLPRLGDVRSNYIHHTSLSRSHVARILLRECESNGRG